MGLRFPHDLDAWRRWQGRRRIARRLIGQLRRGARPESAPVVIARNAEAPVELVVVLESRAASSRAAVLAPVAELAHLSVAVVAPFDPTPSLHGDWTTTSTPTLDAARAFPDAETVLSAAHYLPLGATIYADAVARGLRYGTVQHGLLTPAAPPLPEFGTLLAWSDADARFWLAGHPGLDVNVVGSQLLDSAADAPPAAVSRFGVGVYLGQLHGAELPRAGMTAAVTEFCLRTGASYRPHPAEVDRLSRLQHRAWSQLGIRIEDGAIPLADLDRPVVSAFSTGLLEAAARGVPAWAFYPRPPAWLREFWARYSIHEWGDAPTPAPARSGRRPASAVADWVREGRR